MVPLFVFNPGISGSKPGKGVGSHTPGEFYLLQNTWKGRWVTSLK